MSKIEDKILEIHLAGTHPSGNSDLDIVQIEYDPTGKPNSQNAINRAKLENLEVVFPQKNELFVDLDNEHSFLLFQKQFDLFKKFVDEYAEYEVNPSKSGLPKRHVTVQLNRDVKDEVERVMFQALLGSDRVRELLGYVQATNGDPHPTLFLEKGQEALTAAPEPAGLLEGDILRAEDIPF